MDAAVPDAPSPFDGVDDLVIEEIARWLLAPKNSNEDDRHGGCCHGESIVTLLARCPRIDRLKLRSFSEFLLNEIGKKSRASLSTVEFGYRRPKLTWGLIGIVPALAGVTILKVGDVHFIDIIRIALKCLRLRRLIISASLYNMRLRKDLRSALRPEIDLVWVP
jgi:hypothetical protein